MSNEWEGPKDPDPSPVNGMAIQLHEIYQAYLNAGFDYHQATRLICVNLFCLLTGTNGRLM